MFKEGIANILKRRKQQRKFKRMGLDPSGHEWGANDNWVEEPFLFDVNRPFYGKCGICKKETTAIPYVDNGTEKILYSLLGQIDVVRYITRLVYEYEITAIDYNACDRYPYYYCRFCNTNYILCMNSPKSKYVDPVPTCQTQFSANRIDIPFFFDADGDSDGEVDEAIHDIFENNESDKERLSMFYDLDIFKSDSGGVFSGTFWKYRTGEFYPTTKGNFHKLKSDDAFYFIGGCYACDKTCTGTLFGKK